MKKSIYIIFLFCFVILTCTKNSKESEDEKEFVIECGMNITDDITLTDDLNCGNNSITISRSDLVFDLGGFTISNNDAFNGT